MIPPIARLLLCITLFLTSTARADDWLFWPSFPESMPAPVGLLPAPACLTAKPSRPVPRPEPCTAKDYETWLQDMQRQRAERRIRIGYDGSRYDIPAHQWTQSSFIQPQMMVHDRYFYDPLGHRYTVDRYLDDLQRRYGGIDSVLIWPVYPNIGVDDRNQHDLIRSMPGGVEGVRQMIADFHRHNVRVFFPMMMWDQGTRDPGDPWPDAIAKLMLEVGADGVNGDTETTVARAYIDAADKAGHPLVFEPEVAILMSDEAVAYNTMSWGYYQYPFVPLVDRHKWLEPRHMVNVCDRWNKSKADNLQFAFFNGVGWESWENVWGIWNGITPRDAEAVRRVAALERAIAPFLVSQDWQPYFPMSRYGVYASRWPLGDKTAWTIVNRNDYNVDGAQMEVSVEAGLRYFDLYHGVELQPLTRAGKQVLSFEIEPKGFGAILASREAPDLAIARLMANMKVMTKLPLAKLSNQWTPLLQKMTPIARTAAVSAPPPGMIKIPAANFAFKVEGVELEGENDVWVDVQYPWESTPRRHHDHSMQVKSFWIDQYPVTNAEFKLFIDATRYRPADDLNFLRHWKNGTYPDGWGNKPVTWVSREDAQAYADWAGKRLLHEWEWQYAAQGTDGRLYPWGNDWDPAAVPVPDKTRTMRAPDDVGTHPKGASPFGVMDLVGTVWQWTSEFVDDHTRASIVRGGNYYQPQGSNWYFPQAYKLTEHGKLLLMAPSLDRSGGIGFRCAKD